MEDPAVERIGETLTMQLGPRQALLTVKVKFRQPLGLRELESVVRRIKQRIHQEEPTFAKIFLEADSLEGMGEEPEAA